MTKKKSQVKAKSPAARKITKKGSTQPLQTKKSDDQTNMKPKKPDSIQEIKSHTKVAKKTSNVKKKTSMASKAEIKEEADEIGGPSLLSRRFLTAGSMVLILLLVYLAGKRRGERTKTFIEVIRAE